MEAILNNNQNSRKFQKSQSKKFTPKTEPLRLKVHDIMAKEEIKIFFDDNISNALRIMDWEGLKHVCVFNCSNKLIGILNYEDAKKVKNRKTLVKEVMHRNFHTIYGMLDADVGIQSVIDEPEHCLPVYENKKVVGILNIENIFTPNEFN